MRTVLIALLAAACIRPAGLTEEAPRPPARVPSPPVVVAAAPLSVAPAIIAPAPLPSDLPSADLPPAASDGPAVAAADPREATRKAAHEVLVKYCGECHEGHRSKNARALAVYDLDKPDWWSRFDDKISPGALRRLASKSDEARDAFLAFRDAERAASDKPH